MLARSLNNPALALAACGTGGAIPDSMFELSTLNGRLSRLPPNKDEGARARTDASVSIDLLLLLFEDDASVRMEALSVSRLLAVAVPYVAGCPPLPWGARCAGRAVGGEVGNWWENCMLLLFPCVLWLAGGAVFGAADCIVVSVVVSDRTDGAGEENVLSAPLPLTPHPTV